MMKAMHVMSETMKHVQTHELQSNHHHHSPACQCSDISQAGYHPAISVKALKAYFTTISITTEHSSPVYYFRFHKTKTATV